MADDVQAKLAEMWNTMDASWESYGKSWKIKRP